MQISISVDDNSGALAAALAKLLADVDAAALKSGHPMGSPEVLALLSAAVSDIMPILSNSSAALAAIKLKPIDFALALGVELASVLAV